jgi:hypothetical protein
VALYTGDDTDFPDATPATSTNLVDAIVYGTGDADDVDLLAALGETTQWDESLNGASATESLQLTADGMSYETKVPTFRAENDSAVCPLSITGTDAVCDDFTPGTDTYSATIDFAGGGTGSYTIVPSSGSVDLSAGDPDTDATGTITITGIDEGTDLTLTIQDGGLCDLMTDVTSPSCVPTATLPIFEPFDYADGSLVGNGGWVNHGGTAGDLLVESGQALVQHGTPSEDVNLPFTPVSGNIYFGMDISVIDPGAPISGTDSEYFAHFKNDAFGFSARVDIVAPTGGGDYTVGIATVNGTADATWGTDLTYGTTYRIIVRFDQDTNIAELWVDATSASDPSILGADESDPGDTIYSFALRQSDSAENEGILVDNLVIAQTFDETTLSTEAFTINSFNVYPNPASNGIVNITSANSEAIAVTLFDILGKQVLNQTVSNNTLNVSALNSGVYILKMVQNGNTSTKKLVIR